MTTKACSKCHREKDLSSFYKTSRGLRADCKDCYRDAYVYTEARRSYQREYKKTEKSRAAERARRATPEYKAHAKEYNRAKNSTPEAKAKMREYIKIPEVKERRKSYNKKSKYGISQEVYDAMYTAQGGNCLVCSKHFLVLCVDHDHATGEVRGLLCQHCNKMLGLAYDDTNILQGAIKYLLSKLKLGGLN